MKVLIIPLLAVAAAAQPQFYNHFGYTGLPVVGQPIIGQSVLAQQPLVYSKPVEYKPLQTMEYEKINEKPMEKKVEEPMKIETYSAIPSIYGQQLVYKTETPVLTQKVGVPARFHIKNGELEHTSFTKREAEPVYPFYNYQGVSPIAPVSPIARAVIPGQTVYGANPLMYKTVNPTVVYKAPEAVVYKAPEAVVYKTPVVQTAPIIKQEPEYLKPKVEEPAKTVANDAITPFMYAGKGVTRHETPGTVHLAKREAEPFYGVLPYNQHIMSPYYGSHILPQGISTYGHILPQVAPVSVKTFKDDRISPENYAGKGVTRHETAGSLHLAKRDADADPITVFPYNTLRTGLVTPSFYSRPAVTYTSPLVSHYNTIPTFNTIPTVF